MELRAREIKFRAYHKTRKEVYPVEFINFDKKIVTLIVEKTINGEWYRKEGFDSVELMQYTGLKDNNSVEIYEGDIVDHSDGEYSFRGIVVYSPFGWYVESTEDSIAFEHFSDETNKTSDCSVIGNTFENWEGNNNKVNVIRFEVGEWN